MFVDVALPNTRLDGLTYSCDNGGARIGSLVKVELRRKHTQGVVVGLHEQADTGYTKPVMEVIDDQFLKPELLELLGWTARYYFASWGEMLTVAIPRGVYTYRPKKIRSPDYGVPKVGGVQKDGVVPKNSRAEKTTTPPTLSLAQHQAVRTMLPSLAANDFKVFLLIRQPGTDTTEIYLRLIEETLCLGKSAIVLRPEVALTKSLLVRFAERFPADLVPLHSGLTRAEDKSYWQQIRTGRFRVVVGSRRAIFAPVKNLGLVIVDDEHDASYKEKRQPHYHSRDVGIMRAKLERAVAVLGSSTPSVETAYNAREGKYELVDLREERKHYFPVVVVDMRREKGKVFSAPLKFEMKKRMYSQEQILLFINRRGFSPFLRCADCGYAARCPECNIPLVYHHDERNLRCHFCKYVEPGFEVCPKCHGASFSYRGIGTETIEKELLTIHKKVSILRLDSDTAAKPENFESICQKFNAGKAKVLVGTQLALREVRFPGVTLVGIIDADTSLQLPDFHSAERTFQTLSRAINAIGESKNNRVVIQTFHPQHYAIRSAQRSDFSRFLKNELAIREDANYPPFARIALVRVSAVEPAVLDEVINSLSRFFETLPGVVGAGPVVASRLKRKGAVYQWLLKTQRITPFHTLIDRKDLFRRKAKVDIDIDPV